jgi:hypothetical protein
MSSGGRREVFSAYRPAEPEDSDRALFDAVLRETEAAFRVGDPADAELLADLRQVARAFPGRTYAPEPIGVEMVRVILDRQVSRTVASSRIWRGVCDAVAETLSSDPAARERLERLWTQIQGGAI